MKSLICGQIRESWFSIAIPCFRAASLSRDIDSGLVLVITLAPVLEVLGGTIVGANQVYLSTIYILIDMRCMEYSRYSLLTSDSISLPYC
jgi:hypothetical protein